jgi:hypothetical protein
MNPSDMNRSGIYGFTVDASGFDALEFLERSRDVASEVVVDGTRGETSTSQREEITHTRPGPAV